MLNGKDYLIISDYYSGHPEVITLTNTTTKSVVNAIKFIFSCLGVPDVLITDNDHSSVAQSLLPSHGMGL